MNWQPSRRGLRALTMLQFAKQPIALELLERNSIGRYRWPIWAANDGDAKQW